MKSVRRAGPWPGCSPPKPGCRSASGASRRISAARPLLASGRSVITVAAELGYETTSAFSTVFRRFAGMTPSAYAKLSDSA